jgi:L-asparagine transporter-like permease
MPFYTAYITFIILVKILFIIFAISHLYFRAKGNEGSDLDKKVVFWKDRMEFVFIFLMSMLLIYLFNPRKDRPILIDKETKILLYLFGFILLITAKWSQFIEESSWFKKLQEILR